MKKDKFFGRGHYLEILHKRMSDLKDGYRQNIAILGDELVGKTSMISKLLDQFCDNRVVTLYVEVRPESLDIFVKRFIAALLYNFLINSGITLKEDLDFLISKSEKYIPKTIIRAKQVLASLNKRKKEGIFLELLALCESIHEETGKSCVVIFDEFHNLESLGVKGLYREWSKLLIAQKNTMYVIISSMTFKAKSILAKNLSLLFGNFEIITVEPFDIDTSEKYLKRRLGNLGLNPGLNNFIIQFTGGYPFYLEVIADSLLKRDLLKLSDIIENMLFDTPGLLNQRFSNYLKRFLDLSNSQEYISILYLIASGHNKIKDITHLMHKTSKELSPKISHLLELDTLTRSGDFLKINDRVFSFWLKSVYREKMNSLTFDARNQQKLFKENIENEINEFLVTVDKPIVERMTEIFRLFQDDLIQIERKKIRLDHFREIKPLEFNNRCIKSGIIGRSSDSLWIMGFKHDPLTEEDIAEFAKECKKYRHKLQRKIIVTFRGVDTNARLRALDEKILTWDLNSINQIFDLFSKPSLIV